jgi:hypothetical protein
MKILDRHKTWIHTHFLTDCVRLAAHHVREIESRMASFLRMLGIVFGVHVESHKGEPGIRIVLECIPSPETLDLIQAELQRIVAPIPSRPRTVVAIRFARPSGGEASEATEPLGARDRPGETVAARTGRSGSGGAGPTRGSR